MWPSSTHLCFFLGCRGVTVMYSIALSLEHKAAATVRPGNTAKRQPFALVILPLCCALAMLSYSKTLAMASNPAARGGQAQRYRLTGACNRTSSVDGLLSLSCPFFTILALQLRRDSVVHDHLVVLLGDGIRIRCHPRNSEQW